MSEASKFVRKFNNADIKPNQITLLKSLLPDSALLLTDFYFDCGVQIEPWEVNLKSETLIVFSIDCSTIAFGFDFSANYIESTSKWYTVRGNLGKYIAKYVISNDLPSKRSHSKQNTYPYMKYKNRSNHRKITKL